MNIYLKKRQNNRHITALLSLMVIFSVSSLFISRTKILPHSRLTWSLYLRFDTIFPLPLWILMRRKSALCYSWNFELRAFPRERSNVTRQWVNMTTCSPGWKLRKCWGRKSESSVETFALRANTFWTRHPGFNTGCKYSLNYCDKEVIAQLAKLRINELG